MNAPDTRLKEVVLALLCILLLYGCAARQVRTVALSPQEQDLVMARFQGFMRQQCGTGLDADLSLEFKFLGRTRHARGMIQTSFPSSLRYSTIGPLGQPLNIMVTDGENYTMIDNRAGKAYVGPVGSDSWNKYVPGALHVGDVLPLLIGRLPELDFTVREVRGEPDAPDTAWIFMKVVDGTRSAVRFDRARGVILRYQQFREGESAPILDVAYDEYDLFPPGCLIPRRIRLQGKSITGSLLVGLDRVYPESDPDPARFHLTIPEHYTVERSD